MADECTQLFEREHPSLNDKQSFSGNETRGQLDFTARFVLVQSPAVLAKGMLGMIRFDESTKVKNIAFPTIVVAAENDPVTLPSASQFLTDTIPDAYCVKIPMGKHQAQMEMNESVLGALKGFVRQSLSGDESLGTQSGPAPLAGTKNVPKARLGQG
jgi:pimeloyl-ACP methyl ester carboxylesterase